MDSKLFELAEKQAALCKMLGNSRRLFILWQISNEELSVNEIAIRVGSTLQNVSQHLNLFKKDWYCGISPQTSPINFNHLLDRAVE